MAGKVSEDPFNTLDDITIVMHELLESYIRSGFTRKEALDMVKIHLVDYLTDPGETE